MDGIEEVRARLSIEDVVSEYVQLKRAGRNWRGISPFTNEKTPSLMVSPEKQIWHDFSSGKGGNMFGFVMEMEGLDFRGALELLARKAGVDLDQYRTYTKAGGGPDKARLHELLGLSTKFYQVQFSKHKVALEYVFDKRKFTKETALTWRLGYAPNNGTALVDFLKTKGFTEAEMKQSGVSAQRYRGVGDMFRGRLMIPLQDPQGQVIGFTARLLGPDDNAPKYINTPGTVLYDKSRHVFGLHLAKESIRKNGFVVVAEGNLDVIASHQAGVRQVVATAGTALTEQHLKALGRLTEDIRLCFDADRAGIAATERSIPIASKVGVSLSIIDIPNGKDPDELIRRDPELWRETIINNQYALDWLIARYKKLLDISSAKGKRQFSDVLLPIVRHLSDSVEQDHYMVAIAEAMGISREALEQKSTTIQAATRSVLRKPRAQPEKLDKQIVEYTKAQDHLLSLGLLQPKLRDYLEIITPSMMNKAEAKQLLKFLKDTPDFSGAADAARPLKPISEYVKIIGLQYEELYQGLELSELHYEAARLQARLVREYVKDQKQILAAELERADEGETNTLLEQVKQLDELLKQLKGGM